MSYELSFHSTTGSSESFITLYVVWSQTVYQYKYQSDGSVGNT